MNSILRQCLVSLGIACFLLLGSGKAADGNPKVNVRTSVVSLGREFNLKAGNQVTVKRENLRIKFAEVTGDSRCPSDVNCVWAGNAAVRLVVSLGGRGSRSLTLNTSDRSKPVDYRGYKITLVGVSPYPRSNSRIAPGDYVVSLLVSKESLDVALRNPTRRNRNDQDNPTNHSVRRTLLPDISHHDRSTGS